MNTLTILAVPAAVLCLAQSAQPQTFDVGAAPAAAWSSRSAHAAPEAATTYKHDDGASNNALGIIGGAGGQTVAMVWLQRFDALGGADTLTEIEVAFGTLNATPVAPPAGTAYEVHVYEDPNDDGLPLDAVLLVSNTNTSTSPDTDTLEPTSVPPAVVNGAFFVAVKMNHITGSNPPGTFTGQFPAAVDNSVPSNGRAWFLAAFPAATWNPTSLVNNTVGQPYALGLTNLDSTNFTSVFLLRAEGLGSAPTTFCTAKPGLACGPAAIGSTGTPSASAASGFVVRAGPARSCKSGILLYNTTQAGAPLPFQGGTLCVNPQQLRRAGSTSSMGTPGGANCDGQFVIDMNTFAQGAWSVPNCDGSPSGLPANTPAAFLKTSGQDVFTQFWGRDSVATGSFVSNGLRWTIGP